MESQLLGCVHGFAKRHLSRSNQQLFRFASYPLHSDQRYFRTCKFCHSVSYCVISVQYCDWETNVLIPESFTSYSLKGTLVLR